MCCSRHDAERVWGDRRRSRRVTTAATICTLASIDAFGSPEALAQVTREVKPPTVLTHVDAMYPPSALAAGKHSDVVLALTIGADGHVSKVEVVESGGRDLDEAAVFAARLWTFTPAMRNDTRVASRIRVPFHFAPPAPPPEILPSEDAGIQGTGSTPPPSFSGSAAQSVDVRGKRSPPGRGASDFRLERATLSAAPHASAADLLSSAPGFYVAHPEGEAVAQRVYLRGFDAEHGQDVEFKVSGIPLNQPSHLHGQGYADLDLIIPETVRSLRVVEGVYDPHQGDFAVAGSVDYDLGLEERGGLLKLTYGSFDTKRLLALWAPPGHAAETFGAATFRMTDGFGGGTRGAVSGAFVGQYQLALSRDDQVLLHVGGHAARANLAGALRRDDIEAGRVGFYDAYPDPSARAQSAGTSRTQLGLTFDHRGSEGSHLTASLWSYLATFRSRMNFTGYVERSEVNPEWVGRGDLIEQSNHDFGLGGSLAYRSADAGPLPWMVAHYELGAEVRTHGIEQAQNLLKAPQNETWDQRVDARVRVSDVSLYLDGQLGFGKRVRVRGGGRADLLFFDVDDRLGNFIPAFSQKTHVAGFRRTAAGIAAGPRATLEADPLPWLRISASYGEGYRSPQARQLEEGERAPFAKVKSYEIGTALRHETRLALVLAAYQTSLSYDLAFDPGEGRLERIGPTTRRGVVAYLRAKPASWLHAAVSATTVHATLDAPPIPTPENPSPPYVRGQSLPYVPPVVVRTDTSATGSLGSVAGHDVTLRVGYATTFLSARPLPYGASSPPVFVVDALAALRRDSLELSVDVTNVLGARYADTEYAFVSNWNTTPVPSRVPARHITAGAPRAVFANLTVHL